MEKNYDFMDQRKGIFKGIKTINILNNIPDSIETEFIPDIHKQSPSTHKICILEKVDDEKQIKTQFSFDCLTLLYNPKTSSIYAIYIDKITHYKVGKDKISLINKKINVKSYNNIWISNVSNL